MSNEARTKRGNFQIEPRAKQEEFQIEARANHEKKLNEQRANYGEKTIEQRVNSEDLSNEQLVARIQSGVDTADNMLRLWQQTRRFITMLAKKYSPYADMEDLEQEGYISLCEAVRHYDVEQGAPFISYAAFWIRQGMRRYVENCSGVIRIPVHAREWVGRYKKIAGEYRKYYGAEPSERALCYLLQVSREKLHSIQESVRMSSISSLSQPIPGEDGGITFEECIPSGEDMEEDVMKGLDSEMMRHQLWEAVDSLEEVQSQVIRHRFQDRLTVKETAQRMDIGPGKARQIERKAMRNLRLPSRNQKFRGYYEEYMSAASSRHIGIGEYARTWTSEVERDALHL